MTKRMDLNGWYKLRWEVLARDHFTCQYCGQAAPSIRLEVDHRVALADGGTDALDNLVASCWACNRGKSGLRQSIVLRRERQGQMRQMTLSKPAQHQLAAFIRDNPGLTSAEIMVRLSWNTNKTRTYLRRAKRSNLIESRLTDQGQMTRELRWYPVGT